MIFFYNNSLAALAAMYMQSYQYIINIGTTQHSFPTAEAYNLVFLTAAISLL